MDGNDEALFYPEMVSQSVMRKRRWRDRKPARALALKTAAETLRVIPWGHGVTRLNKPQHSPKSKSDGRGATYRINMGRRSQHFSRRDKKC
jgi:hypothetical protein